MSLANMKMRGQRAFAVLLMAVVLAAAPVSVRAQASRAADSTAALWVVHSFKKALADGDSLLAIRQLHPEVVILEGSGMENLEQYRSGHLAADIRAAGSLTRTLVSESLLLSGDVAVYTSRTNSTGTNARGRAVNSNSNETVVLVRTAQGWRIRHIHW